MRTLEAKILDSTHLELSEPILGPPGHLIEISLPYYEEGGESPATGARPGAAAAAASTVCPAGPRRDRELAWRRAHADVLQTYAGEWVILEGEEIVAHGRSPAQLVEQARAQGIEIPYVFYVGEPQVKAVSGDERSLLSDGISTAPGVDVLATKRVPYDSAFRGRRDTDPSRRSG